MIRNLSYRDISRDEVIAAYASEGFPDREIAEDLAFLDRPGDRYLTRPSNGGKILLRKSGDGYLLRYEPGSES